MAISERINPDNLNIHQFQEAPEGRPELPFDADRDVSPEMRDKILTELRDYSVVDYTAISMLADAKILWPDSVLGTEISDADLISLGAKYEKDDLMFCSAMADIKIIRPDFELTKMGNAWQKFSKSDQRGLSLKSRVLLNPDGDNVSLLKIEADQLGVKKNLDILADKLQSLDKFQLMNFVGNIAKFRLIDRDYKPNLNDDQWQVLHDLLVELENDEDMVSYVELAADMKIVAAYKVEVTAPGVINIQMHPPEDLNSSVSPVPEKRKF